MQNIWEVVGLSVRSEIGTRGSLFVFKDQMDHISLEDLMTFRWQTHGLLSYIMKCKGYAVDISSSTRNCCEDLSSVPETILAQTVIFS